MELRPRKIKPMSVNSKMKKVKVRIKVAIQEGDLVQVQTLVRKSNYDFADPRLQNYELLSTALTLDNPDIAEWLLEHDCTVNSEFNEASLHKAIQKGYNDLVRIMLERGACPEVLYCEPGESIKDTALHLAVKVRNIEAVKLILAYAKLDIVNIYNCNDIGCTPFHLAVANNCLPIFQLLLKCNPDLRAEVWFGLEDYTVLHFAIQNNVDHRIMEALINAGADINEIICVDDDSHGTNNSRNYTPLDYALVVENYEFAKLLLMHNAEINNIRIYHKLYKKKIEFIEYIVLLQSMNKFVNTDFLSMLSQFDNFEKRQKSCSSEIEKMKITKIIGEISYYDLLVKQSHNLAAYGRNQAFIRAFESKLKKCEKFPLYMNKLKKQFYTAKYKACLLEHSHLIFNKFFPYIVCEKIFDYLNLVDLKNVSDIKCSFCTSYSTYLNTLKIHFL